MRLAWLLAACVHGVTNILNKYDGKIKNSTDITHDNIYPMRTERACTNRAWLSKNSQMKDQDTFFLLVSQS
jgi:hypothetical protein